MSSQSALRAASAGALRAEMARQQKTSTELAHILQCSQSSASRRMTGEVSLDLDELGKVATWLDVDPSVFLDTKSYSDKVA